MNILADENMPLAKTLFSKFGTVRLIAGRKITPQDLVDVDALMIRSVTKVNAELLSQANKLRFIGTATAGFDHVDTTLCQQRGITFTNAQGCNKISVGEYVLSCLLYLSEKYALPLKDLSLGVIGAGCTGSEVIKRATALGMKVYVCDPLLQETGLPQYQHYVPFSEVVKADILSFHVPLVKESPYPTYHMLDQETLATFKNIKFIINASRGEVIDDKALLDTMQNNLQLRLCKDVWEGEPNIAVPELIPYADIASMHIAGYAYEAKCRGTYMLYEWLCQQIKQTPVPFANLLQPAMISDITVTELNDDTLRKLVRLVYDVRRDNDNFRREYHGGESFDKLRKNYPIRRELSSLTVHTKAEYMSLLQALGFSVAVL